MPTGWFICQYLAGGGGKRISKSSFSLSSNHPDGGAGVFAEAAHRGESEAMELGPSLELSVSGWEILGSADLQMEHPSGLGDID